MKLPKCKCGAKLFLRNGIPVNKLCPKCRKAKKLLKKQKHETTKTFQVATFKNLHKKAWSLMSLYIRTKGMDENGMNSCYTCGVVKHYKELHAGHFWHGCLDFDERNLKAQCPQCNQNKSGNLAVYATRLVKEYGEEWFKQLEVDANRVIYKSADLVEIIKMYEQNRE